MSNSGIKKVGIITKYNYQSLMDHLSTSSEWDFNTRNGGLFFLPPFAANTMGIYRGKLEALYNALTFLERSTEQYVVLSDSTTICNIDFSEVLESHIESGKDITVIANDEYSNGCTQYIDLVLNMDGGNVSSLAVNIMADKGTLASMGMYIIERTKLLAAVRTSVSHGLCHFEKDYVQREFLENKLSINVYNFDGVVLRNTDVENYYKNSLRMLDENIRRGIFKETSPIYTKVRDEEPTFYAAGSEVKNCLIADGCKIEGYAENSVIFRDVHLERGAYIKNSVIMQGTHIMAGAHIEQAIIDKDVTVSPSKVLIGVPSSPSIIQKGSKI